jgi:hypothetical protein
MLFLVKNSLVKKDVRRDATASSFVAEIRGEAFAHFQAVAVECHSIMWN